MFSNDSVVLFHLIERQIFANEFHSQQLCSKYVKSCFKSVLFFVILPLHFLMMASKYPLNNTAQI